jgi:hypothetical protein
MSKKARGIRYSLDALLLVAVPARLAGYSRLEPMADWARLHAADLAALLGSNVRRYHISAPGAGGRALTVSCLLHEYVDWSYLDQVFRSI